MKRFLFGMMLCIVIGMAGTVQAGVSILSPEAIDFSADGSMMARIDMDGRLIVVDKTIHKRWQWLAYKEGRARTAPRVAWSSSSSAWFASVYRPGTVDIWQVGLPEPLRSFDTHQPASQPLETYQIGFSSDSRYIAMAVPNTVYVWDIRKNDVVSSYWAPQGHYHFAWSRTGCVLAIPQGGRIFQHDVSDSDRILPSLEVGTTSPVFGYSPDKKSLVVGVDKTLQVWDWQEAKLARKIETEEPITGLTYKEDGTELALLGPQTVRLWQGQRLEPLKQLPAHKVVKVSYFASKVIVLFSRDEMSLWDRETGKTLEEELRAIRRDAV